MTLRFKDVPWSGWDIVKFAAVWFGFQLVLGLALGLLAHTVPAINEFVRALDRGDVGIAFVLDLVNVTIGMGLVAYFLRHYKQGWGMVGWRGFSWGRAILYIVAILVFFVVVSNAALWLIDLLVPAFDANQPQTNEFTGESAKAHPSFAIIALVLLPPVLEETIFRGFIFGGLAKKWGPVWAAIGSSVLFGFAHGQANIGVYTFVLGLLLCFMYARLGSIFPGMALHMLNNYLAYLALTAK